ncbi:GMP synthase [Ascobolus immersus RN42]|uniref:GMP synthase n=1 Tax=Ascobolus immersus RN42 TaxID=1160509 RepID=A0A3N4HTS8_ASCIM|nr:GMP synthase [Ascobolus immersus RN42]
MSPHKTSSGSRHRQQVKLLVLETDVTLEPVQDSHGSYADLFEKTFKRVAKEQDPPIDIKVHSIYIVGEHHCNLPSEDELQNYNAVLITGSKYDAHGDDKWILELQAWIREQWVKHPELNWAGVCFGHQSLARALGATLSSDSGTWELSNTEIHLKEIGKELFDTDDDTIHLLEMHQDHVQTLPTVNSSEGILKPPYDFVQIWGSSKKCAIQGLYIKGKMFTTQGHLEVDEVVSKHYVESHIKKGHVDDGEEEEARKRLELDHDGDRVAGAVLRFFADRDE